MTIFIGVDNGNFNQKTRHHVFTTGLFESDKPETMSSDLIHFNGAYYSLTHSRQNYERDKTKDDNAFVLTLFGIAKELLSRISKGEIEPASHYNITLGVGLPPGHFKRQHERFKGYFLKHGRNLSFTYNKQDFNIVIDDVFVAPQAYAAVASKPSDLNRYPRYYIVDIGGYTTDVLLMTNNRPDVDTVRSENMGMIHLYNEIKNRISTDFELDLVDSQIDDVLQGRMHVLTQDVVASIYRVCDDYFERLLGALLERGVDFRTTPATFIGGGAIILHESIVNSERIARADFNSDIKANAIGYEELAKIWKKAQTQKQ